MNEIFACKRDDGPGEFRLMVAHDADDNLFFDVQSGGIGAGIVLTPAQTRRALVTLREFGRKTGILTGIEIPKICAPSVAPADQERAEHPDTTAPREEWHCGNDHLHAIAALSIIAQNQRTNWSPEAIEGIESLCSDAGPRACRDLVDDRLPF